jgi:hypothetical protein
MNRKLLILVIVAVFILLSLSVTTVASTKVVACDAVRFTCPQLKTPYNATEVPCSVPVIFTWWKFYETTTFHFKLSMDPDMSNPVVMAIVEDLQYKYVGPLKCNQNYFWHVRAEEPEISEFSAVYSFYTSKYPPDNGVGSKNPFLFQQWVYIVIAAVLFLVLIAGIWRILR